MTNTNVSGSKKMALASLSISLLIPFIGIFTLGYDALPFASTSPIKAILVLSAWKVTEFVLIFFMSQQVTAPRYVQICFQLNIVLSNAWFIWIMAFSRVSTSV